MGEGPAELEEFHRELCLAFRPIDSFEQMLVEDMAVIRWRRLRLYSAEGEAWHRHRTGIITKCVANLADSNNPPSESNDFLSDENVLHIAKEAYSWIAQDPNEFGSLSEPSGRNAALWILSLALWQFRNDFIGFDETGLQTLKTLYGPNPAVGGTTVLARYAEYLKQDLADETSRRAKREQFLMDLDKELVYYFRLSGFITGVRTAEREKVTSAFRGGKGRARSLSDDRLQATLRRSEDEVMPGEVLDRIIRYESHLERQFERKLQQFVAWRRAKRETPGPVLVQAEDTSERMLD
jgi:hypothetical protein